MCVGLKIKTYLDSNGISQTHVSNITHIPLPKLNLTLFDGKPDSFDAFDETWSQWMDALRAGRARTYIPECLVPHDPVTGQVIKLNPFDNRYFAAEGDMREGQKNVIYTDQPSVPHDSYLASYVTALDLCLQGIISPSTLGIDVKNSTMRRRSGKRKQRKRQPDRLLFLCGSGLLYY